MAIVMGAWGWRVRAVAALGNDRVGFALTGLTACLISPITWVHHLVWLIPGLFELAASGAPLNPYNRQRRRRLWWAFTAYLLLCSDIVWIWWKNDSGVIGFVGSNLYVFICLGLLFWLPLRSPATGDGSVRSRIPAQLVRVIRWPREAADTASHVDGQPLA